MVPFTPQQAAVVQAAFALGGVDAVAEIEEELLRKRREKATAERKRAALRLVGRMYDVLELKRKKRR